MSRNAFDDPEGELIEEEFDEEDQVWQQQRPEQGGEVAPADFCEHQGDMEDEQSWVSRKAAKVIKTAKRIKRKEREEEY